jgi:hypothetical protein
VIRVFPLGFQYMRNAENRTMATRLAHQMMEQVRNDASNLPESVTFSFFDPNTGLRRTISGYDPDFDISENISAQSTPFDNNPYYRDLNLYRYITAEPVKVPLPVGFTVDGSSGSLYTVRFGPIYMDANVGDPNRAPASPSEQALFDSYLKATGAVLTGQSADASYPPSNYRGALRGPQNYVIDYGEGGEARIAFASANRDRVYLVSFSYQVGGATKSVEDAEITVPAGGSQWLPLPIPGGNASDILPGSETVRRLFRRLPASSEFDTQDPYEFKLVSPNLPSSSGGFSTANLGMIAFNPIGANYVETGTTGQSQPFTAYVDYAVLDWHILHDDRDVPSVLADNAGAVPLRTTLSRIKAVGESNADNSLYEGLFPADVNASENADILAVRLDSGKVLTSGDYERRGGTDAGKEMWINGDGRGGTYGSGTIYINTNLVPKGTPVRVFYKADGDWAVSLSKAQSTYKVAVTDTGFPSPPVDPTEPIDPSDPTSLRVPFGNPKICWLVGTRIVFARSELGKKILVTLESGSGGVRRSRPVELTVSTADGFYSYVDIASAAGVRADAQPALNPLLLGDRGWRVVGDIQGLSVKTRVIWKDEVSRRARWRIQDSDMYLTRSVMP